MDSRSTAVLGTIPIGANDGASGTPADGPLKALVKAIQGVGEASADAKRMETQAHKDWPALQE